MQTAKFKAYCWAYNNGLSSYSWVEFTLADGRARGIKFDQVSVASENPGRPGNLWAELNQIQLADTDNFFGNLASASNGLVNTSDPNWRDWHFRPVKVVILDENDVVLDSIVQLIDDIIPSEKSPFATLKLISPARRAADVPADGERAIGTSGGSPIPLFGAYGAITDPTLYETRIVDESTGELSRGWYKHRSAFDILRKTAAALADDHLATPAIGNWEIPTADGRRIISSHHAPPDYIAEENYTALAFIKYDGVDYLFLAARDKLYQIDLATSVYSLIATESNGYYFHYIFRNPGNDKIYAVAVENSTDHEINATLTEYDIGAETVETQSIVGQGDGSLVYAGSQAGYKRGLFAFKYPGGTGGDGALYFESYNPTDYGDRASSTAYGVGDKVNGIATDWGAGNDDFFLECTVAGTTAGSPIPQLSAPYQDGDSIVDGTVTWRLTYRLLIEARNCFDIGGASWGTNLGNHIPLMQSPTYGYPPDTIRFDFGIVKGTSPVTDEDMILAAAGSPRHLGPIHLINYQRVTATPTWGIVYDDGSAIFEMVIATAGRLVISEARNMGPYYLQRIRSMLEDGTDIKDIDSRNAIAGLNRMGLVLAPDDRVYYFANGENMLYSTDGDDECHPENWLFDPGGGAAGPPVPAFEMASNRIWDGTSYQGFPLTLTSGVPLVLDDQSTDWRLFGISQPDQALFVFGKNDYGFIDLCDWSELSIAAVRNLCAKRLGGLWFYDKDGVFTFAKRITGGAATYAFAEGQVKIEMTGTGRDKIENRYVFIPRQIALDPVKIETIQVQLNNGSTLAIAADQIVVSPACNESALYQLRFENGSDLDEWKLYKWDAVADEWDLVKTGDRTVVEQYEYLTVGPAVFGGTAIRYDQFQFAVSPSSYQYQELTHLERTEVEDSDSIDQYGVREHRVDEAFIKRILSLDVLKVWLNQTKDPRSTYRIRYPVSLVRLTPEALITITSAKFGLTSSIIFRVVKISYLAKSGQILADAEIIDATAN